jgi:hypothetical protein
LLKVGKRVRKKWWGGDGAGHEQKKVPQNIADVLPTRHPGSDPWDKSVLASRDTRNLLGTENKGRVEETKAHFHFTEEETEAQRGKA